MAFKVYVPTPRDASWRDYWSKISIEDNLKNCDTDGLLPVLLKYLPKKGKTIEAGCGLGKWIIFLRRRGYNICGTDSFAPAIQALKKYDSKLPVKVDKVENSAYPDNSFDAYLSFGVIEHFEKGPQKALREAHRLLKENGLAIIETPYDNFLRRLRRLRPRNRQVGYFYEYHYTKEELVSFVRKAGFKVLATYPKDDTSAKKSIGLWLDFPRLRQSGRPNFLLNSLGKLVKKIFSPWPELWSACVVVVAKKE